MDELKFVLEQHSNATVNAAVLDSLPQPDDGNSDRRQLRKNIKEFGDRKPTGD